MRVPLVMLGMLTIIFYALFGALAMNDWAVAAASGLPLDATIAGMESANQPYSHIPGFTFAVIGMVLALVWCLLVMPRRRNMPRGAALLFWAGIIALGAPAYFFSSFANLNSVGDAYPEWNAEAAFALEAPLYLASGIAFLIVVALLVAGATRAAVRRATLRQEPCRPSTG